MIAFTGWYPDGTAEGIFDTTTPLTYGLLYNYGTAFETQKLARNYENKVYSILICLLLASYYLLNYRFLFVPLIWRPGNRIKTCLLSLRPEQWSHGL